MVYGRWKTVFVVILPQNLLTEYALWVTNAMDYSCSYFIQATKGSNNMYSHLVCLIWHHLMKISFLIERTNIRDNYLTCMISRNIRILSLQLQWFVQMYLININYKRSFVSHTHHMPEKSFLTIYVTHGTIIKRICVKLTMPGTSIQDYWLVLHTSRLFHHTSWP